jgi:hypothetical protein
MLNKIKEIKIWLSLGILMLLVLIASFFVKILNLYSRSIGIKTKSFDERYWGE